jgi:dihydrofolate reductase
MGQVIASASMSLDGFIARPDHGVEELFDWYDNGDVVVENAGDLPAFRLTEASAAYWLAWRESLGALVVGRELFDLTDGWRGTHPLGVPFVLLTHRQVTSSAALGSPDLVVMHEGIVEAVSAAQELAGDKVVGVAAGTIASQALRAGLLDAVNVDLVPVFLGSGRAYFTGPAGWPAVLADPTTVVRGRRVTHLSFPVRG